MSCKPWIHSAARHGTHQLRPTSKNGPRRWRGVSIATPTAQFCDANRSGSATGAQQRASSVTNPVGSVAQREGKRETALTKSSRARHDDRGKDQPAAQAKGNETAGPKAAQPKKPSQLEQARTALQSAKSAELLQGVIASLEQEVEKRVLQRSPPDRSPDRCCESKAGKCSQGGRSVEGTLAHGRGARQGEPTGEDRRASDLATIS